MYKCEEYQKLEYHYEIILARLELKEVFLRTIVQEVYENIGQLLSLIRVQIGLLAGQENLVNNIDTGELIGQAIRDLRNMCRHFYPELELLADDNLSYSLQQEINRIYRGQEINPVQVKGAPGILSQGTQLLLFRMLQEIIYAIRFDEEQKLLKTELHYNKDNLSVNFQYRGKLIDFNSFVTPGAETNYLPRTPVPERIKVINGKF